MSFSPSTPLPNPKFKRNSFESSASPLFSPSAAARYAAQTEQWNQAPSLLLRKLTTKVDKWLARVFCPNRVPEFERNEETLSYLYTLSGISNQRTKEKQALLAIQERMIETFNRRGSSLDTQLKAMGLSIDSLDAQTQENLEELVQIGMVVGVDPVNATTFDIAKAVSEQIGRQQELQLRLHEIESLERTLDDDLAKLQQLKSDLERARGSEVAQQDIVDEKFSEWTRSIKLIQAKTEEYQSRQTTARRIPEELRISNLEVEEGKVVKLKEKVAEIQTRVDGYAMLPHDEKEAKREVEKLKAELERVRRRRDAMWEDITNG